VRLCGERPRNIGFGDKPVFNQKIDNIVLAIQARARFIDLLARNQAHVLEDFEDVIFVLLHGLGRLPSSLIQNCSWREPRFISRFFGEGRWENDEPGERREELFDGHAFGQIARLIDVPAELDGEVIGKKLQRNHG
jgi:hypothetical protein